MHAAVKPVSYCSPSWHVSKKVSLWEPAISLHSYTQSHWSSGSTLCFPSWGTQVQSPGGVLMWNRDSPVSLSCYIGDPDVIDNCGLVWGRLCTKLSLGWPAYNVIIPLDLTQLSCPGFTLTTGPPAGFTSDIVGCWGGSPVQSLQSHCIHTESHWSSGSTLCFPVMRDPGSIPRGDVKLMWNRDFPVSVFSLQAVWFFFSTRVSATETCTTGTCYSYPTSTCYSYISGQEVDGVKHKAS